MKGWSENHKYGVSIIPELMDRLVYHFNDFPQYNDLNVDWELIDDNLFNVTIHRPGLTEDDLVWAKHAFSEFEKAEIENSYFYKARYDRNIKYYYPESITICFKIV